MEYQCFLVYLFIIASFCLKDIRADNVLKASAKSLQRVKRVDPGQGNVLQRVKRLDENDFKSFDRVRRDIKDKSKDTPNTYTEETATAYNEYSTLADIEDESNDPNDDIIDIHNEDKENPIDNDESRDDDVDNDAVNDNRRKSYFLGPNAAEDDKNATLPLRPIEFMPELDEANDDDEPVTKRFDKKFMRIKQKWKNAMRKRGHQKYRLKKKMAKLQKHKEVKDITMLKRKRKHRYHK